MTTSTSTESFVPTDFTIEYGVGAKNGPGPIVPIKDELTGETWFPTIQKAEIAARRANFGGYTPTVIIQRAVTQPSIVVE